HEQVRPAVLIEVDPACPRIGRWVRARIAHDGVARSIGGGESGEDLGVGRRGQSQEEAERDQSRESRAQGRLERHGGIPLSVRRAMEREWSKEDRWKRAMDRPLWGEWLGRWDE